MSEKSVVIKAQSLYWRGYADSMASALDMARRQEANEWRITEKSKTP